MRELVVDLATGKLEYIEFVPVNSWSSTERIPDYLFNHRFDYVDHTRAAYPMAARVMPTLDAQIHSHDKSAFIERPASNPCFDLPKALHRNGDFTRHMVRAYTDIMKTRDAVNDRR